MLDSVSSRDSAGKGVRSPSKQEKESGGENKSTLKENKLPPIPDALLVDNTYTEAQKQKMRMIEQQNLVVNMNKIDSLNVKRMCRNLIKEGNQVLAKDFVENRV